MAGQWISVTGKLMDVRLSDEGIVVLLEDEGGQLVTALFHESSREFGSLIEQNSVVTIRGEVKSSDKLAVTLVNCELGDEL
jgi:hypothetical protein